jgi:hypothetical protein
LYGAIDTKYVDGLYQEVERHYQKKVGEKQPGHPASPFIADDTVCIFAIKELIFIF